MNRNKARLNWKIPCEMPTQEEFLDHLNEGRGKEKRQYRNRKMKVKISFGKAHRAWHRFSLRSSGSIKRRWRSQTLKSRPVKRIRLHERAKVKWRHRFRIETRRYLDNVQIQIPEWDADGSYQLSPFYGDPNEPNVFQWAHMLVTSIGSFHARDMMVSNVFEQYGSQVELRFTPVRFVFPSKQAATMFLLRFG